MYYKPDFNSRCEICNEIAYTSVSCEEEESIKICFKCYDDQKTLIGQTDDVKVCLKHATKTHLCRMFVSKRAQKKYKNLKLKDQNQDKKWWLENYPKIHCHNYKYIQCYQCYNYEHIENPWIINEKPAPAYQIINKKLIYQTKIKEEEILETGIKKLENQIIEVKRKINKYQQEEPKHQTKEQWPICEVCNSKFTYISKFATKIKCEEGNGKGIIICSRCYDDANNLTIDKKGLAVVKICPKHSTKAHLCRMFSSIKARKNYKNSDAEDQYDDEQWWLSNYSKIHCHNYKQMRCCQCNNKKLTNASEKSKCEICNKIAYTSKLSCEEEKSIKMCFKCYNNQEKLIKQTEDVRVCPKHTTKTHLCRIFGSKQAQKNHKNLELEDWEQEEELYIKNKNDRNEKFYNNLAENIILDKMQQKTLNDYYKNCSY